MWLGLSGLKILSRSFFCWNCQNNLTHDVLIISNQLITNLLKFEIYMCGPTIKCVPVLVLIFEQGEVQADISTTLCVTIVGVDRIFNCGHVEKRPSCGHGEQTFESAFEIKYIHTDDVNRSIVLWRMSKWPFWVIFLENKFRIWFCSDFDTHWYDNGQNWMKVGESGWKSL